MSDDKPWPQVPMGNKNHTNAAVVIIGAGISGLCTAIDLIKRNNCRNFVSQAMGRAWVLSGTRTEPSILVLR